MALVAAQVCSLDTEMVPLRRALGRVIASPIHALSSAPPFDVSAMDGFALAVDDVAAGCMEFAIGADLAAGSKGQAWSRPGTALPISTGACVPGGCGAIVVRERCSVIGGRVRLGEPALLGANIRRAGEDAATGACVMMPGDKMTAAAVGALASYGLEAIEAYRRPRLALLVTGVELQGQLHDANGPMLACALEQCGATVREGPPVADTLASVQARISEALTDDGIDMILSTGGVSVGAHDHVPAALASLGARVHFHGVAMRPGKPVLFATLPNGKPFFGLPGNPVAALVGFRFFITQAIRRMAGRASERGSPVALPCPGKPGLTIFLKAASGDNGQAIAILPGQESHKLRPLLAADRWVMIAPAGTGFAASAFPLEAWI